MKANSIAKQSQDTVSHPRANLKSVLNLESYQEQWVALAPDRSRVLAADTNLQRLDQAVIALGLQPETVILHRVTLKDTRFLG